MPRRTDYDKDRRRGAIQGYPWEEWFSRVVDSPITLRWGKDYDCGTPSMAMMLRRYAMRYLPPNKRLSVSLARYSGSLIIRVVNRG